MTAEGFEAVTEAPVASAPKDPAPVCQAQEQTWWNQKCSNCGHNLMLHAEIEGVSGLSCALCEIRHKLDVKIEDRSTEIDTIRTAFNGLAVPLSYPEIPAPERLNT